MELFLSRLPHRAGDVDVLIRSRPHGDHVAGAHERLHRADVREVNRRAPAGRARDDERLPGLGQGLRVGDDDVERHALALQDFRAGVLHHAADYDGVAHVLAHADGDLGVGPGGAQL